MYTTNHINQRMNQRGINKRMIETVLEFGQSDYDRISLNRSGAEKVIALLESKLRALKKIADKGGITVVYDNNSLISTWNIY